MNQKGFIQIPLLVIVIASIVIASVGTGVILYKQEKLKLTADVSETLKQKEIQSAAEVSESINQEQIISSTTEPIIEESAQEIAPVISAGEIAPMVEEVPAITSPTTTQSIPQIEVIQQQINQISEEQTRISAEQARQASCIELANLKEQIQKLCHSYYFVELDRCIEIRQKDVADLSQYVLDFDNPESDAYKLWETAGGRDKAYYQAEVADQQSKVDQMISLKPQYESAKAECEQ